jgi:chromosome partitioning protein
MFREKVFDTKIRTNVALAQASAIAKSVFDHAPSSNGAFDYNALSEEIMQRYELEAKE